jgi:Xaa-Pro aminopeptidase
MDHFPSRRERIQRYVAENDLDGFLVTTPANVSYLTNFSGDSSYLLVGSGRPPPHPALSPSAGEGGCLLVSDGRYTEQIRRECPGLATVIRPPSVRIGPATAEVVHKLEWKRVGFESGHMTVAELSRFREGAPGVDWKPCDDVVEAGRARKDASEVAEIREAIGMAERAFARFAKSIRPEDSEKQLGDRMEMLIRDEGGRCGSFPTIVAADTQAALPHAPPRTTPIAGCELVLVDWGASGRFYKSDLTRVLPSRKISPKFEQIYALVRRAQERAIAAIRPGVKAQDVDAEARAVFDEAGFGDFFSHGLGHGLGHDIHEAPWLRQANEATLEAGMVLTVEPGLYFTDWGGIRIEDDVLVTETGCEVLTSVTKDWRELMLGF